MDLVDCDDISEAGILRELETRFNRNDIYSSIGPILIAMNPYRLIPHLYDVDILNSFIVQNQNYSYESHLSNSLIHRHNPHVWMVPFSAYQQMRFEQCPQAIVISGESGGSTQ
jgi:myosin heavy subunit